MRGAHRTPRSVALIPSTLILARSASASCESSPVTQGGGGPSRKAGDGRSFVSKTLT